MKCVREITHTYVRTLHSCDLDVLLWARPLPDSARVWITTSASVVLQSFFWLPGRAEMSPPIFTAPYFLPYSMDCVLYSLLFFLTSFPSPFNGPRFLSLLLDVELELYLSRDQSLQEKHILQDLFKLPRFINPWRATSTFIHTKLWSDIKLYTNYKISKPLGSSNHSYCRSHSHS